MFIATSTDFSVHPRCNVLGVRVSAIDMDEAVRLSDRHIQEGRRGYVCVTGVHGVMEAQSDPTFESILNSSFITTPDGTPMVWVGRMQGHSAMSRVYGPDFMLRMCELSIAKGYRHFLYGGNPGVAELLARNLTRRYPGLLVVGTYTPPFRPLIADEERQLFKLVEESKPHIIWVGLSTPKQERFMAQYTHKLPVNLLVGVGAAFDIHTGRISDAPQWIKRAGMQWLHRLLQEPKRLGRRYAFNNSQFLFKIALQMTGICRYDVGGAARSDRAKQLHLQPKRDRKQAI
jgi:N-acetylglucosaminyldiphosphoundecaprenol N-acetyl-beta-D-mannosaminyltransferase